MDGDVATAHRTPQASLRDPAIVGAVGVGALALLRLRDPHESGSYGWCPFLQLTGLPCPGCGGLRAVNDLTHGHLGAALTSNALAVGLALTVAIAWLWWVGRRWRGREGRMVVLSTRATYIILSGVVLFTVFRWTPWGGWLYG